VRLGPKILRSGVGRPVDLETQGSIIASLGVSPEARKKEFLFWAKREILIAHDEPG